MTGRKSLKRRPRRPRRARARARKFWPSAVARRRWWRAYRRSSPYLQLCFGFAALVIVGLGINLIYQVVRKPSELFFPLSGTLNKTPAETWREYAPIFRSHATEVMTPPLLAAIAQVEGSGNPVAHTYWRWSWKSQPFELYRPASSAVGMYQITDGTFAQARHYCVRNHRVVMDGPWNDWRSCWFNEFYARVIPSHAVELTAAYLDRAVAAIVERQRVANATLAQKQSLAAVIHLCGAGAGDEYARRGFRLREGARCGDHDARGYVMRITTMEAVFERLAASS